MKKLLNRETPAYDSKILGILSLSYSALAYIVFEFQLYFIPIFSNKLSLSRPLTMILILIPLVAILIGGISLYKNNSDEQAKVGIITASLSLLLIILDNLT